MYDNKQFVLQHDFQSDIFWSNPDTTDLQPVHTNKQQTLAPKRGFRTLFNVISFL